MLFKFTRLLNSLYKNSSRTKAIKQREELKVKDPLAFCFLENIYVY